MRKMKKQQFTIFSKNDFLTAPDGILPFKNGKYRARLVPLKEIPYLCKFADQFENRPVLVFDRSESEDSDYFLNVDTGKIEKKIYGMKIAPSIVKRAINQTIAAKYGDVDMAGNPLALDVANFTDIANNVEYDYLTPVESSPRFLLECNPLNGTAESQKLFQEIYLQPKMIDSSLAGSWVLIATDMMGLGMPLVEGFLFSPRVLCKMAYLGRGSAIYKNMAQLLKLPTNLNLHMKNTVSADYSFFKHRDDFDADCIQAQFYVNAQWPVRSKINYFTSPPADVQYNIRFSPGFKDPRIGNLELNQDISLIIAFGEWLTDGQVNWPETAVDSSVVDDMQHFIWTAKRIAPLDTVRADFTFTLWPFMKKCRSHATLKRILEMLIEGIRSKKVRTAVHSTNKSTLAIMFRAAHNELSNYTLEPLLCVQMLLEVGLFCMKETLSQCFFDNKFLATQAEMNRFYSGVEGAVAECGRLYPIFLGYQTVFCLQKFIKFSAQELLGFTRTTIHHFCNSKTEDPVNDIYAFTTKEILQDHLDDTTLTDWRVHKRVFDPVKGKLRIEYIFHFSERIEWQHGSKVCMTVEADEEPVKEKKEDIKKRIEETFAEKGAGDSEFLNESVKIGKNDEEIIDNKENKQEMEIEKNVEESATEESKILNEGAKTSENKENEKKFVAKDEFHGVCLLLSHVNV